jgi:hypothetical protein
MSDEGKFKQLGLFGVIVAEMVVTPSLLGGLAFWLTRGHTYQLVITSLGAIIGLCVAFYRIALLQRTIKSNDSQSK